MSGLGKSAKPIRQLSLQQPAPRRQQIRRQRSAEDDKSLHICANPFARGNRGTGKPDSERPKVRVAWSENRRNNEKQLGQVEVVARQIPGRSRPATAKSRDYVGMEKPPILYSRQELAERLRLAWKHREENKVNINIVLAHRIVEERCDSEMSNHATITAPSFPLLKNDKNRLNVPMSTGCTSIHNEQIQESEIGMDFDGNRAKKVENVMMKSNTIATEEDKVLSKDGDKLTDFKDFCHKIRKNIALEGNEIFEAARKKESEKSDLEGTQDQIPRRSNIDDFTANTSNVKNKTSMTTDCSTILSSIRRESSTPTALKISKDNFSYAKQKRASFHSGANRAFLDPIRSSTEFKWNTTTEKSAFPKLTKDVKLEKSTNSRSKTLIESKDPSIDNTTIQKACDGNKIIPLTVKRTGSLSTVVESKDGTAIEKGAFTRQTSEIRCNSVNDRQPLSKKMEVQKTDQKSRRTSSAPPQRHSGHVSGNRVQVNIVIDTPIIPMKSNDQDKTTADSKDSAPKRLDATSIKISSGRAVRSAPLKKHSRSVKKHSWRSGSCKTDEDEKSRNRSTARGRNSIDSRTIDIVTMVSLVSSADSDTDTENSPGDDKLIDELHSKLPTASIIKTSMNSASSIGRKPIKSVSFQRDSFDENQPKEQQPSAREEKKTTQPRLAIVNHRGNGGDSSSTEETVPWRTDIPGLALPVLALIHDKEEAHNVPLTDREKRCLAVPIGDLHDKKRKLLKTRSALSRPGMEKLAMPREIKIQESPRTVSQKIETFTQHIKTPVNNNSSLSVKETFPTASKEAAQQVQSLSTEPQFHTNKEKECWHLYRKMCDKGVCVSFDTVLRFEY
ncbi:hypothetical protein WN55_05346 [Dufourea novaeangliae]|uniref:Uncharacterized protein n=1 Tax=Dufourea novaeangliae TaxID=178035 RepID=A0A154PLK8_DUFNO|nr:hypothetical protein WN55_05346 [Dufourea novaeangliae]